MKQIPTYFCSNSFTAHPSSFVLLLPDRAEPSEANHLDINLAAAAFRPLHLSSLSFLARSVRARKGDVFSRFRGRRRRFERSTGDRWNSRLQRVPVSLDPEPWFGFSSVVNKSQMICDRRFYDSVVDSRVNLGQFW